MKSAKVFPKKSSDQKPVSTSVCYCGGDRELGTLELFCSTCSKWFHGRCLKDLTELNGVSFMICYVFHCKECSSTGKENWQAKQANFSHMCVTGLANLTAEHLSGSGLLNPATLPQTPIYFDLYKKIIPYMEDNWHLLTSMQKRVKNTWHMTLQKTLIKEKELFLQSAEDENSFALVETNLADIGPVNEIVKQIGKKSTTERSNVAATTSEKLEEPVLPAIDGPKTRGASKRRNAESAPCGKKTKLATDYCSGTISGSNVDYPFNKDHFRYFLAEPDPSVNESHRDDGSAYAIPPHSHRFLLPPVVSISRNDRAYQLQIDQVNTQLGSAWTVAGHEGYAMARASHGVCKGTWYYEVLFKEQPDDSQIRIGWSQPYAVLQACVGYNKFSYSWRSKAGTKFHDGRGKKYFAGGFKEGDVLGCLIHFPTQGLASLANMSSKDYLPECYKDSTLVHFKHNLFFEVHDETAEKAKNMVEAPGSKIEFFCNGKSCGVAFENIYAGYYFPSVSIFHRAKVAVNFGPRFAFPPPVGTNVTPMSSRADEQIHEQCLSDMLFLVENNCPTPSS